MKTSETINELAAALAAAQGEMSNAVPEEEKQMEADAEVERLHAEVAQQASVIADLDEALTKIAEILERNR